jgi:hypothetical protein
MPAKQDVARKSRRFIVAPPENSLLLQIARGYAAAGLKYPHGSKR